MIIISFLIVILICSLGLSYYFGYKIGLKHKTLIVHTNFDDLTLTASIEETKYKFMPREMSDYICNMCNELNIDSDLAASILMIENPQFNPEATHRNNNGSLDTGLWQLNDVYLYRTFVPAYWDLNIEFNVFNWKHNTFIALHLIKDLSETLKIQDEVIMAYNCGTGTVMSGEIPDITYTYLARVKNTMELLKHEYTNRDN